MRETSQFRGDTEKQQLWVTANQKQTKTKNKK